LSARARAPGPCKGRARERRFDRREAGVFAVSKKPGEEPGFLSPTCGRKTALPFGERDHIMACRFAFFYPQQGRLTDRFGMSDIEKKNGTEGPNTGVIVKPKARTKKPSMYKVLMLNDDYTPMEFVVHILERFFNKNREEANRIMMHVHRRGVGVCGVYTYEVAETKVTQVMDFARQHQHPLQCTLEKD
jgi:ATP-dependent Clp protease adaptor protein ClpS